MVQARKLLIWLMLVALATLVSYFSFRGYLGPDLLLHFANALHC